MSSSGCFDCGREGEGKEEEAMCLGCGSSLSLGRDGNQWHIGRPLPRRTAGQQRRISHLQRLYKLSRQIAGATDEKRREGAKRLRARQEKKVTVTSLHSGH